jgi:hypothetical protein
MKQSGKWQPRRRRQHCILRVPFVGCVQRPFTCSESQGHRPHPLLIDINRTVTGLDSLRPAGRFPTSVPPRSHASMFRLRGSFKDRGNSGDSLKRRGSKTRTKTVQSARSNSNRKQISCPIIGIQASYRGKRKLRTTQISSAAYNGWKLCRTFGNVPRSSQSHLTPYAMQCTPVLPTAYSFPITVASRVLCY